MKHCRRGFSLIELSMVIAISGLMLSFLLQSKQSAGISQCYSITKNQLVAIRNSVEMFARKNDRLPMPASRTAGVEGVGYGREALAAAVTTAGSSYWGAVPFQALGLPPSFAADCWGNKLTYVVTSALTTSAGSGGFGDISVNGSITLKKTAATTINTTTAYAIISHGEDGLGAVKANATAAAWCSGATLKSINCLATTDAVADSIFNNGNDAGANYYDDIIVASAKPQTPYTSNLYCWGTGGTDQGIFADGDTTNHSRLEPRRATSNVQFSKLMEPTSTPVTQSPCGLASDGTPYCWGYNGNYELGDGTTTNRAIPTKASTSVKFDKLYQFTSYATDTYALTSDGSVYVWGANGYLIGTTPTPTAIATTVKFTKLVGGGLNVCGITAAGDAYCWGNWGNYLNSSYSQNSAVPVLVEGGHKFSDLDGMAPTCGLTRASDPAGAGKIYCWGSRPQYEAGFYGANPLTITNITKANPGIVTYTGNQPNPGDTIMIRDVIGMPQVNYQYYTVQASPAPTSSTFSIGANTSGYGTYSSNGHAVISSRAFPIKVEGVDSVTFAKIIPRAGNSGNGTGLSALATNGEIYTWGGDNFYQSGTGTDPHIPWGTVTNVTQANPAVVTTSAPHGLHTNDMVMMVNMWSGMTQLNQNWYKVGTVTSTTFQLINYTNDVPIDSTSYSTFAGGNYWQIPTDGTCFDAYRGAYCHYTPTPMGSGLVWADMSIGDKDFSGITTGGALYGWGSNEPSTGDGTSSERRTPVPLNVPGGAALISPLFMVGWDQCAQTASLDTYCWGLATVIGDGTSNTAFSPTLMHGGLKFLQIRPMSSYQYYPLDACGLTAADTSGSGSWAVLVVGGGGGAGINGGGGGGGGGVTYNTDALTNATTYTVTVGAGGITTTTNMAHGANGGNSIFGSIIALGGGGGASRDGGGSALSGGSGGGGSGTTSSNNGAAGGTGTGGQGNSGGSGTPPDSYCAATGGGGGGAGGSGVSGINGSSGSGGVGASYTITGTSVMYGSGGGGGIVCPGYSQTGGASSAGGGLGWGDNQAATGGLANTGGGAGGGASANGGSGVVIIRYTGAPGDATVTGGGTSAIVGSDTVWTFTSSGTFTYNSP